jgi:drug/metabolite transporter (DMT)-like permease
VTAASEPSPPSRTALVLGFLAIYLIWGSTYLAIRVAVGTLPPFLMAATRFVLPGAALVLLARSRGAPAPTAAQWRGAAVAGNLMLLGGNGLVSWAEQWVPSGLAALLIAVVPLWMGLLQWMIEPAARPGPRGIAGILLGFVGVAILVDFSSDLDGGTHTLVGSLAIVLASLLWASGSLAWRRADAPRAPLLGIGMQMLAGSAGLAVAGTVTGEWARVDPAAVSTESLVALVYLMILGSIVAFGTYTWLLRVSTPAKVATYAYVNPVIAVVLGWAILDETLTARTLVAAAIIVTAVVMITTERRPAVRIAAQSSESSVSVSRSHSA